MEAVASMAVSYKTPQGLSITEEQFNLLYPDMIGHYDFFNDPIPADISDAQFENTYLVSKLWRLNNLYTITRKDGTIGVFKMNYAQHVVYSTSRKHPRIIILKSRQQGISTFWLVSFFDDCLFVKHFKLGMMAQGEAEATTLFERTKFLWDELDDSIKQFLQIKQTKDNTKELAFSNNSTIFIRLSFRSTTLQRLHISEFGKIANQYPKRARETKTGTLQALAPGLTGVIESTAEGRNEFMFMWDKAVLAKSSEAMAPKDFYPIFLSWLDDPDCLSNIDQADTDVSRKYFEELKRDYGIVPTQQQKNFWIIQYRELGADIYQEYPATPEEAFRATRDGSFWAKLYNTHVLNKKRLLPNLADSALYTDVFCDLGVDDYFVMGYTQWFRGEYRLIDEYFNQGYAIEHYIDKILDSGYDIRNIYMPHDIAVRELGSANDRGLARSRLDIVREVLAKRGSKATVKIIPKLSIADGIENVRRIMPNLYIDSRCEYMVACILNYSKEYDEKLRVFKNTPVHDEYSHGADVLRGIASVTIENSDYNRSRYEEPERHRRSSGSYAI